MSADYAKEVREVAEGRTPAALNVESKIDYAGGESAKRQLLKKLAASRRQLLGMTNTMEKETQFAGMVCTLRPIPSLSSSAIPVIDYLRTSLHVLFHGWPQHPGTSAARLRPCG
jgi:hypothetical protein